tara:strand:- start:240 stop:431 length:192 start_codon:yes stop_codon:yes gene_type:complete
MKKVEESGGEQINLDSKFHSQTDDGNFNFPVDAEKANGRWAMIGVTALIGSYITTGQIIPGLY